MSPVILPYKGAAKCTLYFLLDLQFYLISDTLCDDADINPLWFLLVIPDASRVVFFSCGVCLCVRARVCASDFSIYACRTETCTSPFLWTISNHLSTYFASSRQATDESVISCRSYRIKGTVQLKMGNEGSYKTLPLYVETIYFYCRTNASLATYPAWNTWLFLPPPIGPV